MSVTTANSNRKIRDAKDAFGSVLLGVMVGLLLYLGLHGNAHAAMIDDARIKLLGTKVPLIGRDLNGTDLNGSSLEGRQVLSVNLEGVVSAEGETLSSLRLDKTVFHGELQDGGSIGSQALVGASFSAILDDGGLLTLRIQSIERDHADKANKEVRRYFVTYSDGSMDLPLCGEDSEGQAIPAIPVQGRWNLEEGVAGGGAHLDDPGSFTFACEGYAVAKCILAGYKPWRQVQVCTQGAGCVKSDLSDHLQACTRLLRADFCGDGQSHTEDGMWVNVYDGLGVRVDADDWLMEAEWNADGAVCMQRSRLEGIVPACAEYLLAEECGLDEHFGAGTLLMSEIDPGL